MALFRKRLGASAILDYDPLCDYIDPSYDITQKVVDYLNQEYAKRLGKNYKPIVIQNAQEPLNDIKLSEIRPNR